MLGRLQRGFELALAVRARRQQDHADICALCAFGARGAACQRGVRAGAGRAIAVAGGSLSRLGECHWLSNGGDPTVAVRETSALSARCDSELPGCPSVGRYRRLSGAACGC